jgi:hypothetical protein
VHNTIQLPRSSRGRSSGGGAERLLGLHPGLPCHASHRLYLAVTSVEAGEDRRRPHGEAVKPSSHHSPASDLGAPGVASGRPGRSRLRQPPSAANAALCVHPLKSSRRRSDMWLLTGLRWC